MELNPGFLKFIKQAAQERPDEFIIPVQYEGQAYWIKRRPFTKKKVWHYLQNILSRIIAMPVFRATVSPGGSQSLLDEAQRIQLLTQHDIPVPKVIVCDESALVTSDVGVQLHQYLANLSSKNELQLILNQAIRVLNKLHTQGFCHGRPSLGDMTIKNQTIYFIDLEEDPLRVMTLAEAQARDLWLFLNNAARYCNNDSDLISLFSDYREQISEATITALKRMVNRLRPLRIFVELLLTPVMGRDLKSAVKANRALERALIQD